MDEHEYLAMFEVERVHWWFVARRRFMRALFSACSLPDRMRCHIADIGAGTGGMVPFLAQYGRVTGIEPHPAARALARKRGVRLVTGNAEKTGLRRESCDMVCFFDVLYHRGINDRRALLEAMRVIKPGGYLVITDCAFPWLSGPHDRAVDGRERYTRSELSARVKRAGFIVQRQTYLYFLLFPFIAAKRIKDRWFPEASVSHSDVTPSHPWVNAVASWMNAVESFGLGRVSYPWGSSVCVIAKKEDV